ncbi:histone-like nucleoid-structuring protein Lsr2 [Modestobacter sp. URMC 112]
MATKTITTTKLIDDLDGGDATETVSFSIDGKTTYEIDLSEQNAKDLRAVFDKYVSAARKVGSMSKSGSTNKGRGAVRHTTTDSIDPAAVRAWAKGQGIEVSPRGRIKRDVVEQFKAAGN